jgi:hypothetical protein
VICELIGIFLCLTENKAHYIALNEYFSNHVITDKKTFFQQDGAEPHTHKIQFSMPLINILALMLSQIAFLGILATNGLGHHILLISTSVITLYQLI